MQKNIPNPPLAEGEKTSLKGAAVRQLKKLKEAFIGVKSLDATLVEGMILTLSEPFYNIYLGWLYTEAEAIWTKVVSTSANVAGIVAESNQLSTDLLVEGDAGNLMSYRKADLDRLKSMAAGGEMSEELVSQLIEYRAQVFKSVYAEILQTQLPTVLGKSVGVTPIPVQPNTTVAEKTPAGASAATN